MSKWKLRFLIQFFSFSFLDLAEVARDILDVPTIMKPRPASTPTTGCPRDVNIEKVKEPASIMKNPEKKDGGFLGGAAVSASFSSLFGVIPRLANSRLAFLRICSLLSGTRIDTYSCT